MVHDKMKIETRDIMEYQIIKITSRSISIELNNKSPYYSKEQYDVYLDNKCIIKNENKNVISIFDLNPNTTYELKIENEVKHFTTLCESLVLKVKDFNAFGDGIHDDTQAFMAAIACCPDKGCVYVEEGTYLIKPIFLKSNMTFYIEKKATILGDIDRNNYPILPGIISGDKEYNFGTWEGAEEACYASLITAINATNLHIIGQGVIDCQGPLGDWYINHRVKRGAWRPFGVFLNRCSNVLMQGVRVCNTPSWNVHPYFSSDLEFIDIKLTNPKAMPTTDGLDPDCCSNVRILGTYFSVGDDCIAIKSGQIDMAKKYLRPSKNIIIRNCLMEHGHGGVVFGSESSGGIENVIVSQCVFNKTDRGLRIKTRRGRGRYGIIDNVSFENIYMNEVGTPFVVNMFYNMGPKGGHDEYVWTTKALEVDDRTPIIGEFHFKDMICEKVKLAAGVFLGLPEEPIRGISLENVSFTYDLEAKEDYPVMIEHNKKMLRSGLNFTNVRNAKLKNVTFKDNLGDELIFDNVTNFIKE